MNLTVVIPVPFPAKQVFEALNKNAFTALTSASPFPKVKLVDYTGQSSGNKVHLVLDFYFYKQTWISQITDDINSLGPKEFWFTDKGIVLPFPFKVWQHKHLVKTTSESSCVIEEQISYSTGIALLDFFLKPVVRNMFTQRKPIYLKYFNDCFAVQ